MVESESSECWSDSESENLLSRTMSNDSNKTWDAASEDSVFDSDGSPSLRDRLGCLDFKYFERDPPYKRVPLTDKVSLLLHSLPFLSNLALFLFWFLQLFLILDFLQISQLAEKYPGLMTLRSVDMCPASWMAVSW